jgi:S1-C subfamily serine protease
MGWDPVAFVRDLSTAVESYDRRAAALLCDGLVERIAVAGPPLSLHDTIAVLRELRRKRFFELMARVAESLVEAGVEAPCVRCEYAQALIELGMPSATVDLLERARRDAASPTEWGEATGLLGRAYKQMGVATRHPVRHRELFDRAIATYAEAYRREPERFGWHGINAAALSAMMYEDGRGPDVDARQTAARILELVEHRFDDPYAATSPWDAALAAEAQLVLGDHDAAVAWLQRYAADRRADAFELASTLRQMSEVWALDSHSEPGCRILPILRAEMLRRREGARLELNAAEVIADAATGTEAAFEKVLGSAGLVTHTWYRRGLLASRAVARIEHASGRAVGTGFLIDAAALTDRAGSAALLVTNSHVVAPAPEADDTLTPDAARIVFQVLTEEGSSPGVFRPRRILWSSRPHALDTTVLELDGPAIGVDPARSTPARPRRDGKQRVYVIGHPSGRELSYSIDDNVLLDYDDRVMHYRAPTEHGSSGSPVFNRDWDVVAVHHAGRMDMPRLGGKAGTYPANEGIWIEAIRRAMAEAPT